MRHGELLLSAALSAVISPAPASEPPGPAEAAGAASSGGPGGRGEDDTAGVAQALERCLAVVRFAVGMLADMLRPGGYVGVGVGVPYVPQCCCSHGPAQLATCVVLTGNRP